MSGAADYDRMRRTLGVWAAERWHIASEDATHPLRVLDAMAEKSPGNDRKGLRMAINDIVEDIADASRDEIEKLDAQLIAANGISVGELRAQFSKRLRTILKRDTIRSEQEYYLVRNAVEFSDAGTAEKMWSLLAAFEVAAAG